MNNLNGIYLTESGREITVENGIDKNNGKDVSHLISDGTLKPVNAPAEDSSPQQPGMVSKALDLAKFGLMPFTTLAEEGTDIIPNKEIKNFVKPIAKTIGIGADAATNYAMLSGIGTPLAASAKGGGSALLAGLRLASGKSVAEAANSLTKATIPKVTPSNLTLNKITGEGLKNYFNKDAIKEMSELIAERDVILKNYPNLKSASMGRAIVKQAEDPFEYMAAQKLNSINTELKAYTEQISASKSNKFYKTMTKGNIPAEAAGVLAGAGQRAAMKGFLDPADYISDLFAKPEPPKDKLTEAAVAKMEADTLKKYGLK